VAMKHSAVPMTTKRHRHRSLADFSVSERIARTVRIPSREGRRLHAATPRPTASADQIPAGCPARRHGSETREPGRRGLAGRADPRLVGDGDGCSCPLGPQPDRGDDQQPAA
jgi:hypothetical protein